MMVDSEKLISKLIEMVGEVNRYRGPRQAERLFPRWQSPQGGRFARDAGGSFQNRRLGQPEKLAILPRGNGTKMGMGGIPEKLEIVLSTGRLNRITDNDCDNLTLSAEAGIRLRKFQRSWGNRERVLPAS